MSEYGRLTIILNASDKDQKEKESQLFNDSSVLFNEIENYVLRLKKQYPLFEIEIKDE